MLVLNLLMYEKIISPLPVFRGYEMDKTVFLSIRVLLINFITLIVFLILSRSVRRSHKSKNLGIVGSLILIVIIVKTVVEFTGLFNVVVLELQMIPLLVGIIGVFIYIVLKNRFLLEKDFWKTVKFSKVEILILILGLVSYIGLTLPVIIIMNN